MMDIVINPAKSINGNIQVPGDKSISHRALIFGSLCVGEVEVSNFLEAEDCLSTLNILRQLGVEIEQSGNNLFIKGVGKYGFKAPATPLNVGNSGTTLRILPGLLAAQPFKSTLVGDESVSKRPMDRIINPLREMGADIKGTDGHAPIAIKGGHLKGISYKLPVASAQVKSAILLAGLFADDVTEVIEEYRSRNHTEIMLSYLARNGVVINDKVENYSCSVTNKVKLETQPINIPGDISSSAFFIVAALILKNSEIKVLNCGVNETRDGFIKKLQKAGAVIRISSKEIEGEPIADIAAESSNLEAFEITAQDIPSLVDEIPILAVAATQATGTSTISGAQELRVKESDRLSVIATQLKKMGADIKEKPDGLIINGPTKLKGTVVNSGGDHRMAMSLTIAGLLAQGQTVIKNSESIDISFPGFSKLLEKVVIR